MKRCVIVGGAEIKKYDTVKSYLNDDDFYIFCDCGLLHTNSLGVKPNLIVGDFDSHKLPDTDIETIVLPKEKDDTDTFFALKEAISRGFTDFLIIGAVGGRFDHTLANISILLYLDDHRLRGKIIDDFSEMEIVDTDEKEIPDTFPYFSLLSIDGTARGISIRDAKFPLEDAEISASFQYGVSNEPLPGKTARVTVKDGRALLVKIR